MMFPKTQDLTVAVAEDTAAVGKSFLFDFTAGEFVIRDGKLVECDGMEAIKTWIEKILRTEKDRFKIYENTSSLAAQGLAVKILQNGDIHTDGTLSSPCADYAEFFEWQDGNPSHEGRVGYFVKLAGDKITFADEFDTPLGIISAMPAIIGDSGEMHWQGKYITDDFGRVQYHDVVIPAEKDDEGNILIEEHSERQPMLNPQWDSAKEYIPRLQRPEWATVGVLGKLIVYDDGTLQSGDMYRCGAEGKAVKSISNGYPVLKRIADDKVLIWFRG